MRYLFASILAALAISTAHAAEGFIQLPLVDEAAKDVSWQRFKLRLMQAIEKRDRRFLLSVLDPDVRNQTDERGVAEFRKQWEIDAPESALWRELAAALRLGAAYVQRSNGKMELCAPYLLSKWPAELDPFEFGVIAARESVVQSQPTFSSNGLGSLSYHIVRVENWEIDDKTGNANQKWVHIRYGGQDTYVPEEHVRSPVEPAACFAKHGASWRLTGFAPGGGE